MQTSLDVLTGLLSLMSVPAPSCICRLALVYGLCPAPRMHFTCEMHTDLTANPAVQEAAAAGVKVGEARRVLKLLQGLEAALSHTGEGQYALLKAKLEAAVAGGVASPLLHQAHITLERLHLNQVPLLLSALFVLSITASMAAALVDWTLARCCDASLAQMCLQPSMLKLCPHNAALTS